MKYNKEQIRSDAIDYIYDAGMGDAENERFADAVIAEIDRMAAEYKLDKDQEEIPDDDFSAIIDLAFALVDEDSWDDYISNDSHYYHHVPMLRRHGIKIRRHRKTVKHYKTLNNAFLKNKFTVLYSSEIGSAKLGQDWYNSMYFQDYKRSAACTLEYNEFHGNWEIIQGRTR